MTINLLAQQGWQYQNSNLTTNEYGAICAINKDTVFVIADSGVFNKTYNGGLTWNVQNTGFTVSFFDLSFCNIDTGYAVGQNGTIIKTINGGTNWTLLTSGTNKDLFSIYIKTPNNLWAVGDSGVILNSSDYGNTWIRYDTLTLKKLNNISFKNSSIGFILGNGGALFGTTNGGINWDTLNIATSKDLYSLTITDNYAYLLAGWVFDYFYDSDEIFMTTDNINWTSNYIGSTIPGLSKLCFQNDSTGFIIVSNCTTNGDCSIIITKTTDFGQNWISSFSNWNPPTGWVGIGYSDICFVNDSIGYVLCGNNILKTIDGGQWVNIKYSNFEKQFKIYPNPLTSDKLFFEFNNLDKIDLTFEISDIKGMKILSKIVSTNSDFIDLSGIDKGIYFVKLLQENKIIEVHKLIKLK